MLEGIPPPGARGIPSISRFLFAKCKKAAIDSSVGTMSSVFSFKRHSFRIIIARIATQCRMLNCAEGSKIPQFTKRDQNPTLPPSSQSQKATDKVRFLSSENGTSGNRSISIFGGFWRTQFRAQCALLWAQSEPVGDWGFARQGSQMLRRRQRSLHRYDGEVLPEPSGVQAPPGEASLALPGEEGRNGLFGCPESFILEKYSQFDISPPLLHWWVTE